MIHGQKLAEAHREILGLDGNSGGFPAHQRRDGHGAVAAPLTLTWDEFHALPQVDDVQDFHCVTGWSILDMPFRGVRFETLAALAGLVLAMQALGALLEGALASAWLGVPGMALMILGGYALLRWMAGRRGEGAAR